MTPKRQMAMANEIVFEYKGSVYFRPIGRGVCFEEPFMWRGEQVPADRLQFEELFEGSYEMEVVIRRKEEDETSG